MNFSTNANNYQYPESLLKKVFFFLWLVFGFAAHVQAQTWSSSPASGDWNTAGNWSSPSSVPNAQAAFATFGTSSTAGVSLSSGVSVDTIQFNSGASAFTINTNSNELAFFGTGIVNSSSVPQNLVIGGGLGDEMDFYNTSTAGNASLTNNNVLNFNNSSTTGTAMLSNESTGAINFSNNATAGSAAIFNNFSSSVINFNTDSTAGSSTIINVGDISFYQNATAGSSTILNDDFLDFHGSSMAGNSNISNNAYVYFYNNSSAGTATITNNGTGNINFSNNSTAGSSTIANASGATVVFDYDSTAGNSNITNNGNLFFTGLGNGVSFSTAGSATITNNNTMSFNNYSTAGNSVITNNNTINTSLIFNNYSTAGNSQITNTSDFRFLGNSNAGTATITNNSNGTLIFFGNSTAESASITNANNGIVDFADNATAGNSNITNNGNLVFTGQGNGVSFSTAGSATITNNNTMSFNDYATAGNSTIINAGTGTFDFTGDSTAGKSNITNNGHLIFTGQGNGVSFSTAGSATITNNNQIAFNDYSAAANLLITNAGSGGITFFDDATASNSNITNNGSLVFSGQGNGVSFSTAGNAMITNNNLMAFNDYSTAGNAGITNNAGLVFSNNSTAGNATITTNTGDVFFQNTASGGTARFIFNGTSYLDISGETLGNPVTLGSIEGSGSVSLGANNLATGLNNLSTSYSGIVADGGSAGGTAGSVTKIGTGTFTLSGTNSYTGGTNIDGGILVAANSSALGTGSVVVNGGTLSLGGPRTLNIVGNYTQTSAGTLQLGLAGTTAGQWDNLNITGTTSLTGTLNLVLYNGFHTSGGQTFELLDSTSGLSGHFGTIVDSIDEPVSIVYTPNEVILDTLTYSQFALTINEKNIAGDLDNLAANTEDTTLLNALTALPTSSLLAAYDQISPSNLTPIYKMRFMDSQAQGRMVWQRLSGIWDDTRYNPSYSALDGESPMFASTMPADQEVQIARGIQTNPWGGFLNGMGNFGTVTSDGNGAGYQFSNLGTTAGLDYRLAKDLVGGLLIGFDQSGSNQSTGTVNVTGGQIGLYAGWKSGEFHLDALIDGGINSYSTQRTAFDGTANGSTSGLEYAGQLNLGYDLSAGNFLISPFVTGQYTQVNVNGFTETGSLAPLTYGNQGEGYLSSDLGSQFSLKLKAGDIQLLPSISAAWEHVFQGNLDSLMANFGTGNNFTVYGSDTGTDAAVLGGGLNAEFPGGVGVYADYQGTWGMTNFTEQSLSGGINIAFGGSKRGETHSTVKPAATPVATPAVSWPPMQYEGPSPVPSPAATPVVTVLPEPSPVIVPIEVPVDTPEVSPTPFSLGPLVPTQGVITIQTPTATPMMAGSENRPF